jgi:hypothetical protein
MAEKIEERKAIKAFQGRLFKVKLQSRFGSTNIGWCLSALPEGVIFLAEEVTPNEPGLANVTQTFSFCAVKAVGNISVKFSLIAHLPTITKVEQEAEIKVQVVPYDKGNAIGLDRFVEYNDNQAAYGAGAADDDCTQVLKYGYPPFMKYGYPVNQPRNMKSNRLAEDVRPYGFVAPQSPVVKYGSPGCDMPAIKYGFPNSPGIKYGFPPMNPTCEVFADDCGCPVVKYGFPALKYGYPGCK